MYEPTGDNSKNSTEKKKSRARLGARALRRSGRFGGLLGDANVDSQVAAARLQKKTVSFRKLPQIRTGKAKPAFFKGLTYPVREVSEPNLLKHTTSLGLRAHLSRAVLSNDNLQEICPSGAGT